MSKLDTTGTRVSIAGAPGHYVVTELLSVFEAGLPSARVAPAPPFAPLPDAGGPLLRRIDTLVVPVMHLREV